MTTKSSAFTLIELMVVVAIIGILSAAGVLSYKGYVSATKQKSTENAMLQISLAETEEYSNGGEYFVQRIDEGPCTPSADDSDSDEIEIELFGGGDIIPTSNGYEICIAPSIGGNSYVIVAEEQIDDPDKRCTIILTANGTWTRSKNC